LTVVTAAVAPLGGNFPLETLPVAQHVRITPRARLPARAPEACPRWHLSANPAPPIVRNAKTVKIVKTVFRARLPPLLPKLPPSVRCDGLVENLPPRPISLQKLWRPRVPL
jgi:hypothetical protein